MSYSNKSAREQIAKFLILIASRVFPSKSKYVFIKILFGGWCIMDGNIIKQSLCEKPLKGIEWEYWELPEKFQLDLLAEMYKNNKEK